MQHPHHNVIRYTITDCALGQLIVAATHDGVCFVAMGEQDADLEVALEKTCPQQTYQRDDTTLCEWAGVLQRYCNGEETNLDIPLDIQGTSFQHRVWDALLTIPYGETRSYTDVAHLINQPTAVRAVANACGANPVSLIVPCHRVIRSDGTLGGYGSGIERKQALLDMEARNTTSG